MRRPSVFLGTLVGGLTSLPLIALAYLGNQAAGLPFVPFDLFDWLARVLPGGIIRTGIDAIVRVVTSLGLGPTSSAAKRIEQLLGITLVIIGGALVGLIVALVTRHRSRPGLNVGTVAGCIVWTFVAIAEISLGNLGRSPVTVALWLALLIIGWGTLLGAWLTSRRPFATAPAMPEEYRAARRALLIKLSGSIGVALAAWGLGKIIEIQRLASSASQALAGSNAPTPASPVIEPGTHLPLPPATGGVVTSNRPAPAPGTRPEVTSNADFYRIDINLLPPTVNGKSWVLQVSGLFDRPRPLMLSDLLAYPVVTQPITLSCISNTVGGDLISTSYWTGVRLGDVLKDLGLRPEAKGLFIKAADGFYESAKMQDMLDPRTLLVYGMDGDALPVEHGFPLRIYIPNRYGMKQPKWITSIEAVDNLEPGYWVVRGWDAEARPQIVSVIDTVANDHAENGRVPVGGIAWAGDRGIEKVQVQVDDGDWAQAILLDPPLSGLTWVLWRYDWPATPGRHTLRVRATDRTGALQIETPSDTYPSGATGYHTVTATI